MTIFISGGAKSGKSSIAQDLAVKLSNGKKRYYVATMIPTDGEDRERIRRHIADRDGMDFETIEQGRAVFSCLNDENRNGTFLLDSVTALLMNELYRPEKNYESDPDAAHRCVNDLVHFLKSIENAVIVSDDIFSDSVRYDGSTEIYRQSLGVIHRALAEVCDTVVEVSAGACIIHKGELPK